MTKKIKRAWVITQEGTSNESEVIGIISSRKSSKTVKEHVEWLYALLYCYPEEHIGFAKYTKPEVTYEAKFWTTNTGVPMDNLMTCGHNPYLVARLATDVSLDSKGNSSYLVWQDPDRFTCNTKTLQITEKIKGMTLRARVNLPLRLQK